MPKIFISYRRNDSASNAGRIYDRLEGHFGSGQVFMDVDTIRPGVNFVEVVEEAWSPGHLHRRLLTWIGPLSYCGTYLLCGNIQG